MICDAIRCLRELHQLSLVVNGEYLPQEIFNLALPKIRRVCFLGPCADNFVTTDPTENPSLNLLIGINPTLTHIAISSSKWLMSLNHFVTKHISWTKTSDSNTFRLDALGFDLSRSPNMQPSEVHHLLLPRVRRLRVCSPHNNTISSFVRAATSASSISLCICDTLPNTVSEALRTSPKSVERVQLVQRLDFRTVGDLEILDEPFADALASRVDDHTFNLRRIDLAYLPNPSFSGTRNVGTEDLRTLLPRSMALCEKHSILLE